MRVHRSPFILLFVLFTVLIFGCAGKRGLFGNKPDLSKDLVIINYDRFFGNELKTRLYLTHNELPKMLQEDTLTTKLINGVNESLETGEITKVYLKKADLIKTNEMFANNFGAREANVDNLAKKNVLFQKIRKYLNVYFTDNNGFIDRQGTAYKADLQETIGNDIIGPTFAILNEAIWDVICDMPVFVDDNDKPITRTGLKPTALEYGARTEKIVNNGERGITEGELKVIWYLSGLAGAQSKGLTGMALRLFGDLQLGAIVIAGHFSIGDNDTLARIVDEIIKVWAKRFAEWLSYKGYRELTIKPDRFSMLVRGEMEAETPAVELLVSLTQLTPRKN